jgi:hypothetical protein
MKAANAAVRRHKGKGEGAAAAIAAELAGASPRSPRASPQSCSCPTVSGSRASPPSAIEQQRRDPAPARSRRGARAARGAGRRCGGRRRARVTRHGDTVRIVENVLEQRVQILFPGKPSGRDPHQAQSGAGFRWAPSSSAWQRQLTANGIAAARAIVDQLNQENAECASTACSRSRSSSRHLRHRKGAARGRRDRDPVRLRTPSTDSNRLVDRIRARPQPRRAARRARLLGGAIEHPTDPRAPDEIVAS